MASLGHCPTSRSNIESPGHVGANSHGVFARRIRLCVIAAAAALIAAGCVPQQSALQDPPADGLAAAPEVVPPDVDLTAEMLSELIVSELGYQQGDSDQSIETLAALANETGDYRLARTASRRAVNAKRYDIARYTTALWVELTPQDSLAWWVRGVTQIAINDYDGAVASFGNTLQYALNSREQLFADIARAISGNTDPELSYSMFSEIASRYPEEPAAYQILVRFAVASGEDQAVVDQYIARAYELDPRAEFALMRFSLYLEQDRDNEAVSYIKKKLAKYPESEELGLAYAEYLAGSGNIDAALKQLRSMPHSGALLRAANLHYRANRLNAARDKFYEFIEAEPENQDALLDLAKVELELKQFDKARDALDRVIDRQLQFERIMIEAEYAAVSGSVGDGIELLEEIPVESAPQKIRIFVAKQNLYSTAGRWDDAIAIMNQAIEEFPNNTQLRLSRSFVAAEMGLVDVAEADLAVVLDQDPDNPNALNALGYTLTDLTDRHAEALQLIQRALDIRPHDPYILDSMGWVQYKLGNTQAALDFLHRAYRLRLDPVIAAHLGEIYWVRGDRSRAQDIWRKALDIAPDDRVLNETVEKFAN